MKSNNDGVSQETIRELKLLQELQHEYIIPVYHVFTNRGNINVVLEEMEVGSHFNK